MRLGPVVDESLLRLAHVDLPRADEVSEPPLEPILGLRAPLRLDASPRLRPQVRVAVRSADPQRDQVVDLKVRMRPRRQAVFGHDPVVALPVPMAQLARAMRADFTDVGRSHGARRDGRIRQDARIGPGGRGQSGQERGERQERTAHDPPPSASQRARVGPPWPASAC